MRLSPLYRAFIDAGVQAGYPETQDYNGEFQEGFGPMHMTVSGGERESTARAYLKPVLNRPNLTLVTHARAHRVVLDRKRATGVVVSAKNRTTTYTATKEVILSAGSIASPVLLQLSGIGNPDHLPPRRYTAHARINRGGENLQDHLEVYFQSTASNQLR